MEEIKPFDDPKKEELRLMCKALGEAKHILGEELTRKIKYSLCSGFIAEQLLESRIDHQRTMVIKGCYFPERRAE